jgi:hypothetical protein
MEINIEVLRKEKRPLWMAGTGVESVSDLIGGGGDVHTDRLAPEWNRRRGEEDDYDPELAEMMLAGRGCEDIPS